MQPGWCPGQTTAVPWLTPTACCPRGGVGRGANPTHRAQSTAMMRVMSSVGSPTEVSTMTMVTSPAWGMPAAPMLAAVAVMLQEGQGEEEEEQVGQASLLGPWLQEGSQNARDSHTGQGLLGKPHGLLLVVVGGMSLLKVLWPRGLHPWPQQNLFGSLWRNLCLEPLTLWGSRKLPRDSSRPPHSSAQLLLGPGSLPHGLCSSPQHPSLSSCHTSSPSSVPHPVPGLFTPCACLQPPPCPARPDCRPSSGPELPSVLRAPPLQGIAGEGALCHRRQVMFQLQH